MKIKLKKGYVAVLSEDSGEIVGCFNPSDHADINLMTAVGEHFDVESVGLITYRDYEQPFDYEQPYEFILYHASGEDEYITLTMTHAFVY